MKKKVKKTNKSVSVANARSQNVRISPQFISAANESSSPRRANRAATQDDSYKYSTLNNTFTPFYWNDGWIRINTTIDLVQRAYWNFGIVKNTIDILSELSNSRLYLTGGNKRARDFIGAWLDRINITKLKEQFFREYYRSGNIFLYRYDAKFDPEDLQKMSLVYGKEYESVAKNISKIPLRYILLNPAKLTTLHNFSFVNNPYYTVLSGPELAALASSKTQEEKDLFNTLSPQDKKNVEAGVRELRILLEPSRLYAIFAKKQDYEPFSVPMVFPVLEQLNNHLELQRMDAAIARTTDRAILLITNGEKVDDKGNGGVSAETLMKLQQLFQSESVSRTLIADYTTKGEWLIPDINKVLGASKYEELNRQINIGLNSVFFDTDEKFANVSIKAKIFIERLKEPRDTFLGFLQNEIKKVCELMNFKVYPKVHFEDISLKDEGEFVRLFTRMSELGLLTPRQFFEALETGKLPDTETVEYKAEIEEYKRQRDSGLYTPLIGGAKTQDGEPTGNSPGKPAGTTTNQKTKKVKPIGARYSMASIRDNYVFADKLVKAVEQAIKKSNKIKELNSAQLNFCQLLAQSIILNESRGEWISSVPSYIKEVKSPKNEVLDAVNNIAEEHNISLFEASILFVSEIKET